MYLLIFKRVRDVLASGYFSLAKDEAVLKLLSSLSLKRGGCLRTRGSIVG